MSSGMGVFPHCGSKIFETRIAGDPDRIRTDTLGNALRYYRNVYLREHSSSPFLADFNAANRVPEPFPHWCKLPLSLGTVVNLSWYSDVFASARYRRPLFREFPTQAEDEDKWFRDHFTSADAAAQDEFLDQAFSEIFEQISPSKPVWVAEWERLEEALTNQPAEWLYAVGVQPSSGYRQLLIVLRYSLDEVPPLFRPTQLDSGDNHLHYPVPGETEPAIGGFVLNLAQCGDSYNCSREWIHAPFRFENEHFAAAKRRWGWAAPRGADESHLIERRALHSGYIVLT